VPGVGHSLFLAISQIALTLELLTRKIYELDDQGSLELKIGGRVKSFVAGLSPVIGEKPA
jgi:hypothetical protein